MGASLGHLLSFSRVGLLLSLLYSFSTRSIRTKRLALCALAALYYAWRLRLFSRRWQTPQAGAAVFITGADTGIGRSTALYLNSKGFRVFAGVLNLPAGEALVAQAKHPNALTPLVCDVTQAASIASAVETISNATGGQLWGLINNAGIAVADGPVEFVPMDRVQKVLDVNLLGLWAVTRACLPLIRAAKGRVVNIASVNGFLVWKFHAAYCVSKHGVEALSDCLRLELAPLGSFVAIIEPGGIATEIWEQAHSMLGACWNEMGSKCWDVYGNRDMTEMKKKLEGTRSRNSDPIVVARAIHHALTSSCPRSRYKVGMGAGTLGFVKQCPDSWQDAFIGRTLD